MMTSFMSTASLSEATRIALARAQVKMVEAQEELASGRHADVGRTLGIKTAQTISLRQEHARLHTITDTNGILASRLDYTQSALQGLSDNVDIFLNAVIARGATPQGAAAAQRTAEDALTSFADLLNSSYNGVYVFSGLNTDVKPLTGYFSSPAPASRQAADLAFSTAFGVSQGDSAVSGITGAAMQTYLDGAFADMFDSPAWASNWSGAASQNVRSRISPREMIVTSVNANEDPIRKLAQAFTMVADLGVDQLSEGARKAVFDTATRLSSEAVAGLNGMRAALGVAQERVSMASERMSIQIDILAKDVGTLERVDPAEVSVRISSLTTQIETSYALTARLHQLSLVNYL